MGKERKNPCLLILIFLLKKNVLERSSFPEDRDALRMAEIDLALKNEELRKIRIEMMTKKTL